MIQSLMSWVHILSVPLSGVSLEQITVLLNQWLWSLISCLLSQRSQMVQPSLLSNHSVVLSEFMVHFWQNWVVRLCSPESLYDNP